MKTFFAILLLSFTGFAFADGHLKVEEGYHAETEAGSDDHSAHGMEVAPMAPPVEVKASLDKIPALWLKRKRVAGLIGYLVGPMQTAATKPRLKNRALWLKRKAARARSSPSNSHQKLCTAL